MTNCALTGWNCDVGRITASLGVLARVAERRVDAMVAWGRNNRTPSMMRVTGGFLVFPGAVSAAAIGEATIRMGGRHAVVAGPSTPTKTSYSG